MYNDENMEEKTVGAFDNRNYVPEDSTVGIFGEKRNQDNTGKEIVQEKQPQEKTDVEAPQNVNEEPSEKQIGKSINFKPIIAGVVGVAVVSLIAVGIIAIGRNKTVSVGDKAALEETETETGTETETEMSADEKPFEGTLDYISEDGLYAVTIKNGSNVEVLTPMIYDRVEIYGKYAEVKLNEKYGVIDYKNNTIIPIEYDIISLEVANDDVFIAIKNDKYCLIDNKGNVKIPPIYDYLDGTEPQCLVAEKDGRWGVIDYEGNNVIPMKYEYLANLRDIPEDPNLETYLLFEDDNGVGVININDETIIPPVYNSIEREFYKGKYFVANYGDSDKLGLIDLGNGLVAPFEYESFRYDDNSGSIIAEKADGTNDVFIDKKGDRKIV